MTLSIVLEPLHFSHAEIVAMLHEDGFDEKWSAKEFLDLMNMPACFGYLCLGNGEPCGFVLCQGDAIEAEIITIATAKPYRRKGIARRLLNKVCAQCEAIFLEVACDNEAAISFYLAYGFDEIAKRKGYYKRNDGPAVDALVFKYLND